MTLKLMKKITIEKVKIFQKYGGDVDGLARVGTAKQKNFFESDEWYLISSLYQDAELISKGLTSSEFSNTFYTRLGELCDSDSIVELKKNIEQKR